MTLSPVIIFNYNRPDHSFRTWEALSRNQFASETELYLYCDGPKLTSERMNELTNERISESNARVEQTQTLAKQYAIDAPKVGKFKAVHVVCAEKNKGLANSIIGGVTEVINKHGRAIILEDDLLTSPFFLKYMNEALEFYDRRKSVFTISANRIPVTKMSIPNDYQYDVFVSLRPLSTGWATWLDRWEQVDWSLDYLPSLLNHPEQLEAMNRAGSDMQQMLLLQREGKIDSWAIRYCYSHFYNHAIAILPCVPYVDNIGFDGSGTHSGTNEKDYHNDVSLACENPRFLDVLYEDKRIINEFYSFCSSTKRPFYQRVINTIFRKLGKPAPYVLKSKVYE